MAEILADWRGRPRDDAALRAFVAANFDVPAESEPPPSPSAERAPLADHIDALWPMLTRRTVTVPPGASALALPEPYVVPGGRFRELYYWDSYFTMLGLARAGLHRSRRGDDRRFRQPDRPLRPHPQRHPHLLSQPLAAALFRADGGAVAGPYLRHAQAPHRLDARRASLLDGPARRGCAPAGNRAAWCGWRTARSSTAIGTIAPRRATRAGARTSRSPRPILGATPPASIATSAPRPRADGTSARAGWATDARSARSARPASCLWTSTA